MADDGMIMNFEIGDGPMLPKQQFQGGRWRDRLIAKKTAGKSTKRSTPSERPIFNEKLHGTAAEEYIGPGGASRPPKRQRVDNDGGRKGYPKNSAAKNDWASEPTDDSWREKRAARTVAAQEVTRPVVTSGRLPLGGRDVGGPPKTTKSDDDPKVVEGRNAATARHISGKLPPGSINIGGPPRTKKFDDNEPKVAVGINADTAGHISGEFPAGSIRVGGSPKTRKLEEELAPAYANGKLPAGSISAGGPSRTKKFQDDNEWSAIPAKRSYASGANGSFPDAGQISNAIQNNVKQGQIVSSLFSFNPASKKKSAESEEEVAPAQASNAPLTDEAETFAALGLSRRLAAHLATKLDMKAPTAIQKAAVPQMVKDDSDAFIQAETGSGKTLAYLLPIIERLLAMSSGDAKVHRDSGLFAVILAPTRELCKQIATVTEKLLRCAPWIVSTTVIGGESKNSEKARLRKGVNILIATPGRLVDHLDNTEVLNVSTVRWLILDEGDRLMELGFEDEIKKVVDKIGTNRNSTMEKRKGLDITSLPSRRVTILCSATMKMNVQRLGEISLTDAVHIQANPSERKDANPNADETDVDEKAFSAPAQLKQAYAVVPAKLRLVTLTAILKRAFAHRGSVMKAMVFMSCGDSVDFHFSLLSRKIEALEEEDAVKTPVFETTDLTKDTIAAGAAISSKTNGVVTVKLHGSLEQKVRTATLKAFCESTEPCVMICTDVASRGLDLPNVDYVIEYDPPFSSEEHVHRVGRTARAGKEGRALIFLLPGEEEEYIDILASGYRDGKRSLTHNTAEDLLRKGFGGTGHEWEERATELQLDVERWTQESPRYLEMARRGFQSHIRAYATHVAKERHMFNLKTLHLGHLAKAFALRDKPGSIKVPGLRPAKMTKADRSVAARKAKRGEVEDNAPEGEYAIKKKKMQRDLPRDDDAAKRMQKKMREHMSAASEFNIG